MSTMEVSPQSASMEELPDADDEEVEEVARPETYFEPGDSICIKAGTRDMHPNKLQR